MQTQYKTEYQTRTVPVTQGGRRAGPHHADADDQYKTEYQTRTVPVTKVVVEQVPTTQMQTQYKTEYKTQSVPVTRTVAEVVNVPRSYTVYVPKTQTVNQTVVKTDPRADHADAEAAALYHRHEDRSADPVSAADDHGDDLASSDLVCAQVVHRIGTGDDL